MPTSNFQDDHGSLRAGEARVSAPACEAQDLKRILTLLADQIADADRRHSEALAQMQQRLGSLGETAAGVRQQLPGDMTPVIDRLQTSMSALSEQISDTTSQRPAMIAHAAEPEAAAPAEKRELQASLFADQDSKPALRSALAADALSAISRNLQASRAASQVAVDNFDVVDSDPIRAEQEHTWNRVAADALATHYDSPAAHPAATETEIMIAEAADEIAARQKAAAAIAEMPSAPVLNFTTVAPAAMLPAFAGNGNGAGVSPGDIAAEIATVQARAFEDERRWLEERFGDIARRVEDTLKDIDPGAPLASIDARFAQLEQKITDALRDAGKGPDLSALKGIETQVEDLAAQLMTVQTHFSRLDNIELELRSLVERMDVTAEEQAGAPQAQPSAANTDELAGAVASRVVKEMPRLDASLSEIADRLSSDKLAALFDQQRPAAPDTDAIARQVAEQLSRSMPAPAAPGVDHSPQLHELRAMIESFVAEQRHGDEQTNTMLDTMQQAMIRLLDRMDAIEQAALGQPEQDYALSPDQRADYGRSYAEPASPDAARYHQQQSYQAPEYAEPRTTPAPAMAPVASPAPARMSMPLPTPTATVREVHEEAPAAPAPTSREEFIASARRAARMASEQSTQANADGEAAPAPKSLRGKDGDGAVQRAPRRQLSKVSMALLCLVAVGASFALVKSTILAPGKAPTASAPVKSAVPQARPQPGKQDLEDADVIIEEERRGGTGTQRRSQLPGQSGGERDLATAFDGGPSTAVPAAQVQSFGGFTPQMSEFARQNLAAPTQPAALTKDRPATVAPKSDPLPLTIGPNSLRNAAMKGDASAEFEIGARFAEGRGVPQDLDQAISWYQRAAAQGFGPAQYRLGSMFERGLGVKADTARAKVWYQRAAEQGIVKAMHNLAVLSAGRDASATDYELAARWFKEAAAFGLNDSQFNLAIMYDSGLGLSRDAKEAFKWFSIAAGAGDDEAARRRDSLRSKLSPQELADAEAEIGRWRPRSAEQSVNDPRMAGELWKSRTR